ncbi:MAG: hypothetical protein ACK521_06935 [bacterium]|jgi:hypothetical protein
MFRAQPAASKLLSKKWQERDFLIHKERLQQVKPTLSSKVMPAEHVHLKTKPKKT